MKRVFLFILLFTLRFNGLSADIKSLPEYIDSISVKIDTGITLGSGIAFIRKDCNGKNITLIWTAGHMANYTYTPILPSFIGGSTIKGEPIIATFTNVIIEQNVTKNGRIVSTNLSSADFIKVSPRIDEGGDDIAFLILNGVFFNTNSVHFDLSNFIPKLGDPVFTISAPNGLTGTYSVGIISTIGRNIGNLPFDQTSTIVFSGSSGSGIFNSDGKCIGICTLTTSPQLGFVTPIRRIQEWAKRENVEWALDPSIPMPSYDKLKLIKREDSISHPIPKEMIDN